MGYQRRPVVKPEQQVLAAPVNLENPASFQAFNEVGREGKAQGRTPQDDPRQRQPDITLAQNTLGWTPRVNLEDGLKETIDYFRRVL